MRRSIIRADRAHLRALCRGPLLAHLTWLNSGNTQGGVTVRGLQRGTYTAHWTLIDANGDTRTAATQFIEQS
jgi:hypothetical protein